MARARNIKPSFFLNDKLAELPDKAKLLFIGLWCLCDCEGKMEWNPKRVRAELFPYDPDVDCTMLASCLHRAGFIRAYSVDGQDYLWVVNFMKHQHPNMKEKPRGLPDFSEGCEIALNKHHADMVPTRPLTENPIPYTENPIPHTSHHASVDVDVEPSKPVKQPKEDSTDDLPAAPKPRKAPLCTIDQHLAKHPNATADWANYAASTYGWPQQTIDGDLQNFLSYWRSDDAVSSGRKRDWAQTWRNRCSLLADKRTRGVSPQRDHNGQRPDRLTAILGASMATAMQRNGLAGGERPREDGGDFGADTGGDEAHLLPLAASS